MKSDQDDWKRFKDLMTIYKKESIKWLNIYRVSSKRERQLLRCFEDCDLYLL